MTHDSSTQHISRLTSLSAILALIEARVGTAAPRQSAIQSVLGYTLAENAVASQCPLHRVALRDGFAVAAAAIADAGPYAPVPLTLAARRVDVGEPLPSGADAVLPLDAVTLRGDRAEAIAAVTAGEGVLPVGGDATPQVPLRRAGERLRAVDLAVMAAAGIAEVAIRAPRVVIASGCARKTALIDAVLAMLARFVITSGCTVPGGAGALEAALMDNNSEAVIAVGGTGSGRRDDAVQVLARLGRVEAHGIAVSPGETAAFGFAGERPVLLLPGRLDAAAAVWLLLGRYLTARLAGGSVEGGSTMLALKRKVTSRIGMTELIPVSCAGGMAEPLASGYLSLAALTRSDGWIVISPDSEGFAAGTPVAVRPWS